MSSPLPNYPIDTKQIYTYNIKELPASIQKCKHLEELHISDSPITTLPKWLCELPLLKTLILDQCPNLEFPAWFKEWETLEAIHIYRFNHLNQIPPLIFEIPSLKKIFFYNNSLIELSPAIAKLQHLEILQLGYNQLTHLPEELGACQQLKELHIGHNQITQLPLSLTKLPHLNAISIIGNPTLLIPTALFRHASFRLLSRHTNQASLVDLSPLNERIPLEADSLFCQTIPYLQITPKSKSLQGMHPDASHLLPINKSLYKLLDIAKEEKWEMHKLKHLLQLLITHPASQDLTRSQLFDLLTVKHTPSKIAIFEHLTKTNPTIANTAITSQSKLALKGKMMLDKVQVKQQLEQAGLTYQTRLNNQTTHLIGGRNITLSKKEQRMDLVYLTETQFKQFLDQIDTPYLLESSQEDTENIRHIRDLLLSGDAANLSIGLEMLQSLGMPVPLLPVILAIFKYNPFKANRTIAKKLIQLHGSEKLRNSLKDRKKINTTERAEAFLKQADVSPFWFYYYCFKENGTFRGQTAHYLDECEVDLRLEVVASLSVKNNLYLNGKQFLSHFSPSFYQFEPLQAIIIHRTKLKQLPDGIGQLKNLEEIRLEHNPLLNTLPNDLGQCGALKQLAAINCGLQQLPDNLSQLHQLEEIYLNNCLKLEQFPSSILELASLEILSINPAPFSKIPPEIGNLKCLKELRLINAGLSKLPEEMENLKQLEVLDLDKSKLTHIPDFIGQLTQLHSITLAHNPFEQLPDTIGQLTQLKNLRLAFCKQLKTLPDTLQNCQKLQGISMNYCTAISTFPTVVYQLEALEELSLSNTNWSHFPAGIGQLKNLRTLTLSYVPFSQFPEDFYELSKLETLEIAFCKSLKNVPSRLTEMPNLRFISVYGMSRSFVKKIEALLPNCYIRR